MFEKIRAAECVARNTAPVETRLCVVYLGIQIEQRLRTDDGALTYDTLVSWDSINTSQFNILDFHIMAGREALLAEWEGPESTNPNREHI